MGSWTPWVMNFCSKPYGCTATPLTAPFWDGFADKPREETGDERPGSLCSSPAWPWSTRLPGKWGDRVLRASGRCGLDEFV